MGTPLGPDVVPVGVVAGVGVGATGVTAMDGDAAAAMVGVAVAARVGDTVAANVGGTVAARVGEVTVATVDPQAARPVVSMAMPKMTVRFIAAFARSTRSNHPWLRDVGD
jgi:predicted membrane-bound mannosyltransferase